MSAKLIDYSDKPLSEQDRKDLARLCQILRVEGTLSPAWQSAYEALVERGLLGS